MKLKLYATDKDLMIKESERLISGSINMYTCEFTFDESWDGYTVTAVFSTNGSRLVNMAVVDGKCQIPHEVLRPNARIRVGIFGTDGVRSRPTTYSEWITVEQGADVSGNTAQPPTPSVYEQWMGALDEKHEEWNANEQARIEAEADRVEAEQKREDLETGYVAQAQEAAESAEAARKAAEKARDEAHGIAGGEFASEAYVDNKAEQAESNANKYADQKISQIPTPDVSGQIGTHNADAEAHADIREAVSSAETNANAYTDRKISEIPTPDVSGQINAHNADTNAHADIREAVASKAPMYTYGTTDLTAGSSPLANGQLYFVYE